MSARGPGMPRDPRSVHLSPRQRQVWALVATGKSNKEIARDLGIAVGSVRVHSGLLYQRIGVANRTQAAVKFREMA